MLSDNPTIYMREQGCSDYKKEIVKIKSGDKLTVKLMNGGGWAAIIEKM